MADCQNDYGKLIGRVAILRLAEGCPDTVQNNQSSCAWAL
ncbi:Uncharacterised protein [Hafnia alvei]|nr:Uncharacterised protein [Hafnia alvei]